MRVSRKLLIEKTKLTYSFHLDAFSFLLFHKSELYITITMYFTLHFEAIHIIGISASLWNESGSHLNNFIHRLSIVSMFCLGSGLHNNCYEK